MCFGGRVWWRCWWRLLLTTAERQQNAAASAVASRAAPAVLPPPLPPLQEYDKAIETYQAGLAHDPESAELKDGLLRCVAAINKVRRRVAAALLCRALAGVPSTPTRPRPLTHSISSPLSDQPPQMNRGEADEAEMKERQQRGLADPEVQALLSDPVMRQVSSGRGCSVMPALPGCNCRLRSVRSGD